MFSVVEELAEHLAQWSYSVAFLELSFIPAVRLRSFCKATKIERFRREMRQLIHNVCIVSGDDLCSSAWALMCQNLIGVNSSFLLTNSEAYI